MAWQNAQQREIGDWLQRLRENDPKLTSLTVFKTRKFVAKEVQQLREALQGNTHLRELSSSGLPADGEATQQFAALLAQNTTLQLLSLGDSSFGDAGAEELAQGLRQNRTLLTLDLEHKGITAKGARSLAPALAEADGLRCLRLARNDLGNAGAEAIAPCLAILEEADLSSCSIGAQSAVWLALALVGPGGRLRVLRLNCNPLGAVGAASLSQKVSSSPALEELYLAGCDVRCEGAAALAKVLPQAQHLRVLDLSQCGIRAAGAASLASGLKQGGTLQVLRLRGNPLGEESAEPLARAVLAGASLAELDVGSCQLGPAAAQLVGCGKQLRKLSLFDNALGNEGAVTASNVAASEALTALLELELSACSIGSEGMSALLGALQTGVAPALEELLVAANSATEDQSFETSVEMLLAVRPELDIAWTTRNGPPGPAVQPDEVDR